MVELTQALSTPLSAGATEDMLALKALKRAVEIDPADKKIRKAYEKLSNEVEKQKKSDSATFKGFLDRVKNSSPDIAQGNIYFQSH